MIRVGRAVVTIYKVYEYAQRNEHAACEAVQQLPAVQSRSEQDDGHGGEQLLFPGRARDPVRLVPICDPVSDYAGPVSVPDTHVTGSVPRVQCAHRALDHRTLVPGSHDAVQLLLAKRERREHIQRRYEFGQIDLVL